MAVLSGLQQMAANMLRDLIGNLPPEIKQNIDNIGQTVLAFKAQMDRIEANQQTIISALNLSPEIQARLQIPKGPENGERENAPD